MTSGRPLTKRITSGLFFGVFNESPLIRNCELVTGRIFEVYKVNKGRAFFTLVIVFYRDSVLEVVINTMFFCKSVPVSKFLSL
jgi:hypothetical protein